jgi:MoaA/NifB/PqqE/SkfB family radical SAM enzyme
MFSEPAGKAVYRFPSSPNLKDLQVLVVKKNNVFRTRLKGRWPWKAAVLTKVYFAYFSRMKPVFTAAENNVYSQYVPPIPGPAHARQLETFINRWVYGIRRPMAVTIALTDRCQLDCFHCSAVSRNNRRAELDGRNIGKIVGESLGLGVSCVTFTGGEPLLRPDLEEFVALVPTDKANCLVFTNGLAMDERRARRLKEAGAFGLQFSLDSPDPAEHDRLRGHRGTFRAVEEGVRLALQAGLTVGLSTYATNESVARRDLSRLAGLAHEWGVHEVSVFDVISTGKLKDNASLSMSAGQRRRLIQEAFRAQKRLGFRPRILTQSWTNSRRGFARRLGCLAANYQFHITARGEFTPCDFTPLSFGSALREPLRDLWDKQLRHPAYREHCFHCRMQSEPFRRKYIDTIPAGAALPYPVEKIGA